jgi:hypothetical protein
VAPALARKTTQDALQFDAQFGAGQDVFDAMKRLVDRSDTSYQH